jgi:hypothetical protein
LFQVLEANETTITFDGASTEDNTVGQCEPLGGTSIDKRWLPIGGVGEISYSIKLGAVDAVEEDTAENVEAMDARPEILPGDRMGYRIDGGHSFVATVNDMGNVEVEGTADRKSVLAMPVMLVAQDMFDDPTTDGTDYQGVERSLARTLAITRRVISDQAPDSDRGDGDQDTEEDFSAGDYPSRMGNVDEHLKLHYTLTDTKYEITGTIQGIPDEDWFVITNIAPDYAIHVQIVGNASFDLYSADGTLVESRKDDMGEEDPDLADFNKVYVDLRCGNYFVKVTGTDDAEYALGWRVDIDGDATPPAADEG